jgi:hypothetical protein
MNPSKFQEQCQSEWLGMPFTIRVARWSVFKPKINNLGKFWRALKLKRLAFYGIYLVSPFGIFYGHL